MPAGAAHAANVLGILRKHIVAVLLVHTCAHAHHNMFLQHPEQVGCSQRISTPTAGACHVGAVGNSLQQQ